MAITYARETDLSPEEFCAALKETTLRDRRPLADPKRIAAILAGSNFVVTARDEDGTLVGVARCITDFAWICYCSELAVRDTHQGMGIGKALLDKCTELLGAEVALALIAYPEVVDFYEHIGMEAHPAFVKSRLKN